MSRQDLESLLIANLPAIDKMLGVLGRLHGFSPDAVEEFAAWAKLKLVENDYAVLAKYRGEAALTTYLTVVLSRFCQEYRVQQWGRWRPSAIAKRAGPIAIRLETLCHRDGLSLGAAGELMRTSGETAMTDRELAELLATFPSRLRLRPTDATYELPAVEGSDRADLVVSRQEAADESAATNKALEQALGDLPDEDRLIVRLHYLEAMSVADIARGLALPQKPLYRRLDRALALLRTGLERAGITRERVRELAADPP
jgi:RNA polymerase sigma factor (sigma-70 family)